MNHRNKKLINEKRSQLKAIPKAELIDQIRSFPNQKELNYNSDGEKRQHQVGIMADVIKRNDYNMTDKQYYTMVDGYSKHLVEEMKVVGVSYRDVKPENFKKELVERSKEGTVSKYDVDYKLIAEPENPYDKNAISVWLDKNDGEAVQIGYLPKDFVNEYPIDDQVVSGTMTDHSNGKFKNVSYQLAVDIEDLVLSDTHQNEQIENTDLNLTDKDINDLNKNQLEL